MENNLSNKIIESVIIKMSNAEYRHSIEESKALKLQEQLNNTQQELTTFQSVLESDETLKALFYEQKQKFESGELNG